MRIRSVSLLVACTLCIQAPILNCEAARALVVKGAGQAEVVSDSLVQANTAFWKRDFASAKTYVLSMLESTKESEANREKLARVWANLAICDAQLENWVDARKEAQKASELAKEDSVTKCDALAVIAHSEVVSRMFDKAGEAYKQAITIGIKNLGEWNTDLACLYEGLGACYFREGQFALARDAYKKVSQLDYLRFGVDSSETGWSFLSLSNVLDKLNESELSNAVYRNALFNFRHQNELRILEEADPQPEEKEQLHATLIKQVHGISGYQDRSRGLDYIKADIPAEVLANVTYRPHDFDNWFQVRVGRETSPGLAFVDPRKDLKAIIITVHGLGLSRNAFTPFAKRICHQGFAVISFDVRGFGSYRNDEIYQRADFNGVISDLRRILTNTRRDFPDTPIFILGESMGGAIALRMAAVAPELVDGVISSVPSGSRYQDTSTKVGVAVKLLKNKNQQFNIGKRIINQATNDPDIRMAWEDDPLARMNLSPAELMAFQRFMDENSKYAEKITNIPVIIFQGYSDQLVKPMSTLALYQAIPTKDKDLLFVGHAEHLIFEEGQFDQDIVDGLSAWINKHIEKSAKQRS